jgi:hypothetical protein
MTSTNPRTSINIARLTASVAVAAALAALPSAAAVAAAPQATTPAPLVGASSAGVIPGRYIVVLKGAPGTARASATADGVSRAKARGVRPTRT